jgi:uncharacterized protein
MRWEREHSGGDTPEAIMDRRKFLAAIGGVGLLSLRLVAVAAQETAQANAVEESFSAGGLAGTFERPASGPARGPVALVIAGSGPTPRDGSIGSYRLIAQGLAQAGLRSYRYDKRGVGGSRALVTREEDVTIGAFADDVLTVARALEMRPDVSSVVLVGHSEGALLATLAAAKHPVAGIVLLAGMGRRLDAVLREQLLAIPLPPEQEHLRAEGLSILDRLVRGERVDNVPPEQAVLFRPSVQPFLISAFAVDPAAELARLSLPTLIVRGASDIQVSRADFDVLVKARPDAKALELPLSNHEFRPAPADLSDHAAQLRSYDPAAPLVPGLVPALVNFIQANAR